MTALSIYIGIEDFYKVGYPVRGLGEILRQLGESQFETMWHQVTGEDCIGKVRDAIWSARDRLETES